MSFEFESMRLTRKGVFMAWRMSEGAGFDLAEAQTAEAYPDGNDADGEPVGEFAAAFAAKHPMVTV